VQARPGRRFNKIPFGGSSGAQAAVPSPRPVLSAWPEAEPSLHSGDPPGETAPDATGPLSPYDWRANPAAEIMTLRIPRLRSVIAAILFLATMINSLDRQALGVLSRDLLQEFHLTEQDYGHIVFSFVLAHAIK
jgi:hypothetical protein